MPAMARKHRALADAGRTDDQHRLARRGHEAHAAQAAACRRADRVRDSATSSPAPAVATAIRCGARASAAIDAHALLEGRKPLRHRLPFGDVGIGIDDEGQRVLHGDEGVGDLHQPAELDLLGEIARRRDEIGKDDGDLGIARGEPGEIFPPHHDAPEIVEDVGEAAAEDLALGHLAAIEGDAFGVLAQPHQAKAEIRLEALLREIERHQRPADLDGEPGAEAGIEQRRPDEIGRDIGRCPTAPAESPPARTGPRG